MPGGDSTELAYDEDTLYYVVADSTNNAYAVRFTPTGFPFKLNEVGLYISSGAGDPSAPFDLTIYYDGGSKPDTVWATLTSVNATQHDTFNWFDVSNLNVIVDSGDFYAGIVFKTDYSPYVGTDVAPPLNHRSWNYVDSTWSNFNELGSPMADSMDLMIRARGIANYGIEEERPEETDRALICQPNPFSHITHIRYHVPSLEPVSLKVYDCSGRLVRTLIDGLKQPGTFTITWDGKDDRGCRLNAGIYFYRCITSKTTAVRKIIVVH